MAYRRRKGNVTWHFCSNCSNWPTGTGHAEQQSQPTTGEFCHECKAKLDAGNCKGS